MISLTAMNSSAPDSFSANRSRGRRGRGLTAHEWSEQESATMSPLNNLQHRVHTGVSRADVDHSEVEPLNRPAPVTSTVPRPGGAIGEGQQRLLMIVQMIIRSEPG